MILRAVNNNPCAPIKSQPPFAPTALGPVDATLRIIHTGRARDPRLGAHPGSFPTRFGRPFLPEGWGSLFSFTRSLVRPAHAIVNPDSLSHVGPREAVLLRTLELCQTVSDSVLLNCSARSRLSFSCINCRFRTPGQTFQGSMTGPEAPPFSIPIPVARIAGRVNIVSRRNYPAPPVTSYFFAQHSLKALVCHESIPPVSEVTTMSHLG